MNQRANAFSHPHRFRHETNTATTTTTTAAMPRESAAAHAASVQHYTTQMLQLMQAEHGQLTRTDSPAVFCSVLPSHWRSNKALPGVFKVIVLSEIADGTVISVDAGNEVNMRADILRNRATIRNHVATFNDLRFIGKSTRGKSFTLMIHINTQPIQVATYQMAIKVTVDGPREPRRGCEYFSYFDYYGYW